VGPLGKRGVDKRLTPITNAKYMTTGRASEHSLLSTLIFVESIVYIQLHLAKSTQHGSSQG